MPDSAAFSWSAKVIFSCHAGDVGPISLRYQGLFRRYSDLRKK
ncbi:hypothetical protein A464_2693 [Salmonella bongori N268-08]|uniref:Uncharacterized protein n=1 Tax=Salmonella bongori N268-08 TaxID=1197719 RepID=S5MYW2_SALBN|nr:hypothetical protein A464_2693 [Salmonella bongori N268-08]